MVFTEVTCPGDHAEGGQQVRGCVGIVSSAGTSDNTRDHRVGGRHGGASVTVNGAFKSNRSKIKEVPNPIPEDKTINPTWPTRL